MPFHHGFDFGPGFGFGLIPLIGTILWIALLAMLAWALIRWLTERNAPPMFWHQAAPPPPMYQPSALEILRQRYARGEIDDATF